MRSREQFKAYVYAKAEAEQARGRKRHRLMFSGIAACSVCICVISAAFLMPHGFYDKSETMSDGAPTLDAFATDATYALKQECAAETGAANDVYENFDYAAAGSADSLTEESAPALKSCLFSVNTSNAMVSNSLVRAAYCEILDSKTEDTEKATENTETSDSGRADVRVAVTAYYLKKPDVSNITISYAGDAVTITVFADAEPIPFGSYVYYFTETLDGKKYFGQPIQLDFKLTSEKDAMKNIK